MMMMMYDDESLYNNSMTKILNKRSEEMKYVKRELQLWAILVFFMVMMPILATTLTFITYSATGLLHWLMLAICN
jgi:heme/copper-type cytochrome/quinol oxidase subunit 1